MDCYRYYVSGKSIVGKIDVERYSSKHREYASCKDENKYMLESTGVGSGSVWREKDLFASEKEALEECVLRNQGKNFKDDE